MLAKRHLTKQGFKEIVDIAYSMNTQKRRLTKEYIFDIVQKKSSQTIRQTPREIGVKI